MYIFLGEISSCFGVISSVSSVMYALTLVDNKCYLFFFKFTFDVMMYSGKYLHTTSTFNPTHVGK